MATEKRLIDANASKQFLENVRQDYIEENTFSSDFAANVIETVQDEYLGLATTVDAVEVVHGRWLPYHEADIGYDEYGIRCSNCRLEFENHEVNFPINYCPNCGADMRERKDNGKGFWKNEPGKSGKGTRYITAGNP